MGWLVIRKHEHSATHRFQESHANSLGKTRRYVDVRLLQMFDKFLSLSEPRRDDKLVATSLARYELLVDTVDVSPEMNEKAV
jgi:hypothetical protein